MVEVRAGGPAERRGAPEHAAPKSVCACLLTVAASALSVCGPAWGNPRITCARNALHPYAHASGTQKREAAGEHGQIAEVVRLLEGGEVKGGGDFPIFFPINPPPPLAHLTVYERLSCI